MSPQHIVPGATSPCQQTPSASGQTAATMAQHSSTPPAPVSHALRPNGPRRCSKHAVRPLRLQPALNMCWVTHTLLPNSNISKGLTGVKKSMAHAAAISKTLSNPFSPGRVLQGVPGGQGSREAGPGRQGDSINSVAVHEGVTEGEL